LAAFPINPGTQVGTLPPTSSANSFSLTAPTVISTPNLLLTPATIASPNVTGLGPSLIPSFAIPTGFPGRVLFPTTGVNVRVPNGDGPMQAPPGLYLSGGGDQVQQPQAQNPAPAPTPPVPGAISIDLDQPDHSTTPILDQPVPDATSVDQDDLDFTVSGVDEVPADQ
jgi:hypothetical protein